MSCAIVVRNDTVRVSFGKRPVLKNDAALLLSDSISGPGMSILTYVNDSVTEKFFSAVARFQTLMRARVQKAHILISRMCLHSQTAMKNGGGCSRTFSSPSDVQQFAYGESNVRHIVGRALK